MKIINECDAPPPVSHRDVRLLLNGLHYVRPMIWPQGKVYVVHGSTGQFMGAFSSYESAIDFMMMNEKIILSAH